MQRELSAQFSLVGGRKGGAKTCQGGGEHRKENTYMYSADQYSSCIREISQ